MEWSVAFITGGASSGKSALAERIASGSGREPVYIATAEAGDPEMARKIDLHKARRGPSWETIETPLRADDAIRSCGPGKIAVLDCLTMWLSNHVHDRSDLEAEEALLLRSLETARCPVVVVSNELGCGIVADNRLARRFTRRHGQLNGRIASLADSAAVVFSGYPISLKGELPDWTGRTAPTAQIPREFGEDYSD